MLLSTRATYDRCFQLSHDGVRRVGVSYQHGRPSERHFDKDVVPYDSMALKCHLRPLGVELSMDAI